MCSKVYKQILRFSAEVKIQEVSSEKDRAEGLRSRNPKETLAKAIAEENNG